MLSPPTQENVILRDTEGCHKVTEWRRAHCKDNTWKDERAVPPREEGEALWSIHLATRTWQTDHWVRESNLVDSASSHTLVSKIKPCMSKYNSFTLKTANGSLYQL